MIGHKDITTSDFEPLKPAAIYVTQHLCFEQIPLGF